MRTGNNVQMDRDVAEAEGSAVSLSLSSAHHTAHASHIPVSGVSAYGSLIVFFVRTLMSAGKAAPESLPIEAATLD